MEATVPAHPRVARALTPFRPGLLVVALGFAASACTPVGWDSPPPVPAPVPLALDDYYLDDSADGAGEPAGIAELELGEEGEVDEAVAGMVFLDAASVGADLTAHFPGFLARGLPPAALNQVLHYVGLFSEGRARTNFDRWLAREGLYRDLILTELAAAGLPEELLYLAMVESGFSPTAVSRAGAVGLWQFMAATGRAEGLRIDDWVDERRDPVAATRAAVAHLAMLNEQLGDWALAAAAYNAGLGRVRRTRGNTGAGYFDMTLAGRLPAETRSYVPLILAASHVARNRAFYGFTDVAETPPLQYETVQVEGRTRLSVLAQVADVPLADVTALNTHLVRGAAPPGRGYVVRMPVGTVSPDIPVRLAAVPADERLLPEYREIYAVVRAGDSWWRIANNHGVTVRDLRARNPRVGDVIHPGMRLLVERRVVRDGDGSSPTRTAATTASARSAGASTSTSSTASSSARAAPRMAATDAYRVRRGDTMSGLARARGVTVAELARWNGMSSPRPLREGEILRLAPAAPRQHRVERGETLTSVARRYGVGIPDLVRWNDLGSARPLREGEVLRVEASR